MTNRTATRTTDASLAAETFARALTVNLPGKTNAGARANLRSVARSWATDTDDHRTLRQAVEARARTIGFSVWGVSAVQESLAAAESSQGDWD